MMPVDISKQEAWKIIDAIEAYKKDYAVSGSVQKLMNNIVKKLKTTLY